MTAPTPTDFEDQVASALRQRADAIAPPDDARAAIDRRLRQRTRTRRVRRVGLAAVVAIVLVAGAVAVVQRGHDDASVVTGPGTPAVHIPQLGLPPDVGETLLSGLVPGRKVSLALFGGSQFAPDEPGIPIVSGGLILEVSDASLEDAMRAAGPTGPVGKATIDDLPALVSTIERDESRSGIVVWSPSVSVVAVLRTTVGPDVADPGAMAMLQASGLIELDDAAWWRILTPVGPAASSEEAPPVLGLTGSHGVGEAAFAFGATMVVQVLDTPGYAPATFQLSSLGGAQPDLLDAVDDPDHVDVRGTSGLLSAAPGYLSNSFGFTRSLQWVEDGIRYRLDFKDEASPEDAVEVAERLSILSDEEFHELLLPATLRLDLVPMAFDPPIVLDIGPTNPTSTPTDPSTPPTTGG